MRHRVCWRVSVVVLLFLALLTGACAAAMPAASLPERSPTPAGAASAPQPATPGATIPASTPALSRAPISPTATAGPRPVSGRTQPPVVLGRTPAPFAGSPDEIAAAIDEFLTQYDAVRKLSGVFHVELNGKTVFERAYGFADTDQTQPIAAQTRFRIGSVSKSMTAAAILLLQEQGKLNVQDSVCQYVPDCPTAWQPVTLHHLLAHSSGIPHYPNARNYKEWRETPQTLEEMVARIRELPASFAPGSQYAYSNSGYVLLSYVVERVSGLPFEQAMKQLVFAPLGMADTGLTEDGTSMAAGHNGHLPTADREAVTLHYGAGGFYSTAGDLSRWAHAWMDGKLLPADLRDLALADHVQWAADDWYGYGIGNTYVGDRLTYGHDGWVEGYLAIWLYSPEDRFVIVILLNNDLLDNQTLLRGIEHRIYQQQ